MSLYSEYLDAKADLIGKQFDVRNAITKWMEEHGIPLLQPVHVEPKLSIDNICITSIQEFEEIIPDFEKEFGLKCIRIFHNENIIPGEYHVEDYWKYHFRSNL